MRCVIDSTSETGLRSKGVMVVANGKMRVDIEVTPKNAETYGLHTIVDPEYIYTWREGQTVGMKAQNRTKDAQEDTGDTYDCSDWTPSDADFLLPSGVTFNNRDEMQKSASGSTAACAICDQLSSDDQERCRTSLHCE